jgi:hypothetical protein
MEIKDAQESDPSHLHQLEELVEELLKQTPDEKRVKEFMNRSNMPYVNDPFERLNMVLKALHWEE